MRADAMPLPTLTSLKAGEGSVALVTGASQGIGRGIALALATAGVRVLITHLPTTAAADQAVSVAEEIDRLGSSADLVPLDLAHDESVAALGAWLADRHRPTILVNNAGVMQTHHGMTTTIADFTRCFTINVVGIWRMSLLFSELRGEGPASIINIGSGAGRRGSAEKPAYDASKAAVGSLTQSLAHAFAGRDITVNCVCPGIVRTEMCEQFATLREASRPAEDIFAAFEKDMAGLIPLGRLQTSEDVGQMVAFLAAANARNITGQTINVDGGIMMF